MEVINSFDFGGKLEEVGIFGNGHINETYCAVFSTEAGQKRYILQKMNKQIFKDPVGLMENISGVTSWLKKKILENGGDAERETLNIVNDRAGAPYFVDKEGEYWRAYLFIEDATCFDQVENDEDFYQSALAFGNFQRLLADYPADTLHETIPDFHNTVKRFANFKKAVEEDACGRAADVQKEIQFVLETLGYAGGGQRNFAGYECFSSAFAFVIEKDTVYGKHTITFAVVLCNPEAVLFGYSVRAAGIERSCFRLGDFLYFTVKFRSGGLVNFCLFLHAEDADSFQHTQRADGICLCGVFRYVERYFYMALCSEVIYFVRLYLLDDADQRAAVRHVTVMQVNGALLLHVAYPFVEVQMFDAPCIE